MFPNYCDGATLSQITHITPKCEPTLLLIKKKEIWVKLERMSTPSPPLAHINTGRSMRQP